MTFAEVQEWIIERYGPYTLEFEQGTYVAVLPLCRGFLVGFGSRRANAVYDLYLQLVTDPAKRQSVSGLAFLKWEKKRHADRDRRRKEPS